MEEKFQPEASVATSDLFHGFLTIGTLGAEPVISEPATPTFSMSLENIAEGNTTVTENDLKLINDELEKFLEAEAEEEWCNESPGRNSQVSIITLSSKQMEGENSEDNEKVLCPLQGYLFGSLIELPETLELKKEKTSLAELFHRTKLLDEYSTKQCGKGEIQVNPIHKSSKNPIRKVLKKLHASSRSSTISSKIESVPTKRKLHKVSFLLLDK